MSTNNGKTRQASRAVIAQRSSDITGGAKGRKKKTLAERRAQTAAARAARARERAEIKRQALEREKEYERRRRAGVRERLLEVLIDIADDLIDEVVIRVDTGEMSYQQAINWAQQEHERIKRDIIILTNAEYGPILNQEIYDDLVEGALDEIPSTVIPEFTMLVVTEPKEPVEEEPLLPINAPQEDGYEAPNGEYKTVNDRGLELLDTMNEDHDNIDKYTEKSLWAEPVKEKTVKGKEYKTRSFDAFHEYVMETNATNLAELYAVINKYTQRFTEKQINNTNVMFLYVNDNGDPRWVRISMERLKTSSFDDFAIVVASSMTGNNQGSDPLLEEQYGELADQGYTLQPGMFILGEYNLTAMYSNIDKDYFMFAVQDEASHTKTRAQLCIWRAVFSDHSNSPLAGQYDESKPISETLTDPIEFNKQLVDQYGYGITLYHDYPLGGINTASLVKVTFDHEPQTTADEPCSEYIDNNHFKPFIQVQQHVKQKFRHAQVFNDETRLASLAMRTSYTRPQLNERHSQPIGGRGFPRLNGGDASGALEKVLSCELNKYQHLLIVRDETQYGDFNQAYKAYYSPQHFAHCNAGFFDPAINARVKYSLHETIHGNRRQKVKFDLDGADAGSKDRIVKYFMEVLAIKYDWPRIDAARDIIYLNASDGKKASWHLIFPTLIVANSLEMRNLRADLINYMRDLPASETIEADIKAVDATVGKTQNFRMPLAWKHDKTNHVSVRPFKFDEATNQQWRFEDALVTYICPDTPHYILPRCVSDEQGRELTARATRQGSTVQLATDGVDKYFASVIKPAMDAHFGIDVYRHTRTDNYGLHMAPQGGSYEMKGDCWLCNRKHESDSVYFKLRETETERAITYHCWRANNDVRIARKSYTIKNEKLTPVSTVDSPTSSEQLAVKKVKSLTYYKLPKVTQLASDKYNTLPADKQVNIVYYNKHVEPYRGVVDAEFYLDEDNNLLRLGNTDKAIKRRVVKGKLNKRVYGEGPAYTKVTYDLETIYDPADKQLKSYSISYATSPNDVYFRLSEPLTGVSITRSFIEHLKKNEYKKKYVLNGYNSSRFDNLFILPDMLALGCLDDDKASVFYQKNSILNMQWGWKGQHTVFDVCRYTTSSLEETCAAMRTSMKKIGDGISHVEVQRHYYNHSNIMDYFHESSCDNKSDELLHFKLTSITDQEMVTREIEQSLGCKCKRYHDLVLYNIFDVLSCSEVYDRVEKCMHETGALPENVELADCKTIGGMMYKKFKRDLRELVPSKHVNYNGFKQSKSKTFTLPKLTYDDYVDMRSSLIAGRTQCFNGAEMKSVEDLPDGLRMIDVISEYPAMMTQRDFPCGKILYNVSYKECIEKGRIGFYDCVINQSALRAANKPNLLPRRGKDSSLDWTDTGDIKFKKLNTIDLQELDKRGCVVSVGSGLCFTGKIAGKYLFKCIDEFKKVKQAQDMLGSKNPQYNAAMRQMAKLCMNCLSGKVIENLHTDKTELVTTHSEVTAILNKCSRVVGHHGEVSSYKMRPSAVFDRKGALVTYEMDPEKCFKNARPIYLGICIYAYARSHLYNEALEHYNPIYCDTDSSLMTKADFDRFERERPSMCSWLNAKGVPGEFGQFDEEPGSSRMASYVCIAPKNYTIYDKDDAIIKGGFKGINLKRDKYVKDPQAHSDVFRIDPSGEPYIWNQHAAFNLYHSNKLKNVGTNVKEQKGMIMEFCEKIRKQGHAYVLCGSMQRAIANSSCGMIQAGGIYQQWTIKKITGTFRETEHLRDM